LVAQVHRVDGDAWVREVGAADSHVIAP
jgi:hypothetical protein